MNKSSLALLATFVAATAVCAQAQTTIYNFNAQSAAPSGSISSLSLGNIQTFNINASAFGAGTPFDNASTSTTGAYSWASGSYNIQTAIVGTSGLNLATSTYHQFTITPGAGLAVEVTNFSIGTRVQNTTNNRPQTMAIYYQLGGGPLVELGTQSLTSDGAWRGYSFAASVLGAGDQTVTFRIYGYRNDAGNAQNTNWRIDDIRVTAAAVTPVPEPSAFAAFAGLGALGLAATRRRRCRA